MTSPVGQEIDVGRLHRLEMLGDGGQGTVYRVAVPGQAGPMAHKEYKSSARPEVDWPALRELVAFLGTLDDDTRLWLTEHAAWPTTIVSQHGLPQGFLMRLAPDDCIVELRMPSERKRQLLAFEYLLNPVSYLVRLGLTVTESDRLVLLRELADVLSRLHRLGIVVGDLSPKNVVISLPPGPRCFLIDCDAVRRAGVSVLPQLQTPDWAVPAGEELATAGSDVYKIGLLAVRLLAGDQTTTDLAHIPISMPHLTDVIRRSLASPPEVRPSPAEWVSALDLSIPLASTAPPVLPARHATSSRHAAPTARDAVVVPGPAPVSPRQAWAALFVGALLGVLILVVALPHQLDRPSNGPVPNATSAGGASVGAPYVIGTRTVPVRPPVRAPTIPPPALGIIDTSAVAGDSREVGVALLFNRYFSAVNSHDVDATLARLDPQHSLRKATAAQLRNYVDAMSTTYDTQIRLVSLQPGTGGDDALHAVVSFQSRQAPGFGPTRNPNETCTQWTVTYWLSERSPGSYLILRGPGSSQPC